MAIITDVSDSPACTSMPAVSKIGGPLERRLMGGSSTVSSGCARFSSRAATSSVKLPPWPLTMTTWWIPLAASERTMSITAAASVIGRSHTVPAIGLWQRPMLTGKAGRRYASSSLATRWASAVAAIQSVPSGRWRLCCSMEPMGRTAMDGRAAAMAAEVLSASSMGTLTSSARRAGPDQARPGARRRGN